MDTENNKPETERACGQPLSDLLSDCIGLHKERLKSDLSKVELTFVKKWKAMNQTSGITTEILECLFQINCEKDDPEVIDYFAPGNFTKYTKLGKPTDRDRIVAETVIQWLGTNVGRGFLHECGFRR